MGPRQTRRTVTAKQTRRYGPVLVKTALRQADGSCKVLTRMRSASLEAQHYSYSPHVVGRDPLVVRARFYAHFGLPMMTANLAPPSQILNIKTTSHNSYYLDLFYW